MYTTEKTAYQDKKRFNGNGGGRPDTKPRKDETTELPIFDLEAEKVVLGTFMAYPYLIARHEADLSEDDFHDELHKQVYRRFLVLAQRNLNEIGPELIIGRVDAKLKVLGIEAAKYVQEHLSGAWRETPDEIGEQIKELHLWRDRRAAKRISEIAARMATGGGDDLLERLAAEVTRAAMRKGSGEFFEPLGPLMDAAIDKAFTMDAQGWQIPGIATGLPEIDAAIGGLQNGRYYVAAAQEKAGKTSLMLAIAYRNLLDGKKVGIISLELNREEIAQRLVMIDTEVRLGHRKPGTFMTTREKDILNAARERVKGFKVCASQVFNLKPSTLRIACNSLMASDDRPDIIYVDYLQLIAGENDRIQVRERVEAASWALKCIAGDLNIPVVALAQLNRKTIERSAGKTFREFSVDAGRPRRGDVRETGKIEGDVHAVFALYRPEIFLKELAPLNPSLEDEKAYGKIMRPLKNYAEVSVLLCRDGEDGVISKLRFKGEIMKFIPQGSEPYYSCCDVATDGPF